MIYLDHSATTPLDPRVYEEMLPYLKNTWGNPSSPHAKGREARTVIDAGRNTIANLLEVKPNEVIFVSNGSEANSLVLFGTAEEWVQVHGKPGHLIALSIEHDCSIKALDRLKEKGWAVTLLPVDENGRARVSDLESALRDDTALVSIQWANNEVGTIQPVEEMHALCAKRNVPFHCDAVQPVGILPFPDVLPDFMTLSSHKFYGPKGMGALIAKESRNLRPLIYGGGQEFGLRAGTENIAGIMGMAKALELVMANRAEHHAHLTSLNEYFVRAIETLPKATLNGHRTERIPSIANIRFEGKAADTLVIQLDSQGICASPGAACASGSSGPSHVLEAMGRTAKEAQENVRLSFGKDTTMEELDETIAVLKKELGARE